MDLAHVFGVSQLISDDCSQIEPGVSTEIGPPKLSTYHSKPLHYTSRNTSSRWWIRSSRLQGNLSLNLAPSLRGVLPLMLSTLLWFDAIPD